MSNVRKAGWRRSSRPWAVVVGMALLVPVNAAAERLLGTVSGFENLTNPVWSEAKDPAKRGYSFRELVPTVPAKYRKLFPHIPKELCLVALSANEQKPPSSGVLVRVGGGRTTPVTLAVVPGTKLVFQNTDPFSHRLYGVGIQGFTPNETTRGAQREWTVPSAGTFEIRDEAAPSLRMWVVAEPHVAAIAYPSKKGEYALSVTEPGAYTVQAYFAGEKVGAPIAAEANGKEQRLAPIAISSPKKTEDKAD
ncbi:MAG TPA: hypothetical protein VLC09_12460 [Polyangiaceae bacterium]|nr:hypothetical protein [Polyangiaceae bacterium]